MFLITRFDRRKTPKDNILEASVLADKMECNILLYFQDPTRPVTDQIYDDGHLIITYPNCSLQDKLTEYTKKCLG